MATAAMVNFLFYFRYVWVVFQKQVTSLLNFVSSHQGWRRLNFAKCLYLRVHCGGMSIMYPSCRQYTPCIQNFFGCVHQLNNDAIYDIVRSLDEPPKTFKQIRKKRAFLLNLLVFFCRKSLVGSTRIYNKVIDLLTTYMIKTSLPRGIQSA